jgi:hypothetical protein
MIHSREDLIELAAYVKPALVIKEPVQHYESIFTPMNRQELIDELHRYNNTDRPSLQDYLDYLKTK